MKSGMKKSTFISRFAAAAGTAAPILAGSADAAILNWNNAAGGSAGLSTNWNPVQVPTSADDLVYNMAGVQNFAVTFGATTTASRTMNFRSDTVSVSFSSPHTTSTGLTIGDQNSDVASLTFTSGTWNCAGPITVSNLSGSSGSLTINSSSADLLQTGSTADVIIASNAPGSLSITGGGLLQVADLLIAGNNAAGTSTVTISGTTALVPVVRSTLSVLGTSQSRFGQGGDTTVNIANGALASFAGDLAIALGSASTSTVTVSGVGGIVAQNATLDVAGNLLVGRNTTASSSAGSATLNVNTNGRVLVGDTLFLAGDPDGGTATLNLASPGRIITRSLNIGNGATLNLTSGNIDIDGGTLSWTNTAGSPTFNGGTGSPVITMINNASATLSPISALARMKIGAGAGANTCHFDVRSGSDLTITNGILVLGEGADDTGEMIVHGIGSTMNTGTTFGTLVIVGDAGTGRFEAELGATVTGQSMSIAVGAGSTGFVLFENPGTTATFNLIQVGGHGSAGGNGQLVVNQQATLNVTGGTSLWVWPTGRISVTNGGVINCSIFEFRVQGIMEIENGSVVNASSFGLQLNGILRGPTTSLGTGTLNGPAILADNSRIELVSGNLTIGDSTSANGFVAQNGTTVAVGAHTLTLHDSNRAIVDDITINGGTIVAPNGLEIVTPGQDGRMDGTGTFTGSQLFFETGGSVITSTGTNGLTINGQLRNNSGNIDGTKYTFNTHAGSAEPAGWTGAGAINARVVFNSGTMVVALANMTMGLNVSDGVTFNAGSEMHMQTRSITLIDSNGVGLPSITDMNGGDLICQNGLVVNNGRVLRGQGDIDVFNGALTVFGIIEPANDDDANEVYTGLGAFDIAGAYSMGSTARYRCEIAGYDNEFRAMNDLIDASTTAAINGTLDISLINGYIPGTCDTFTIIRAPSVTGQFHTVNAPPNVRVAYLPNRVQVIISGCVADVDDGSGTGSPDCGVTIEDLLYYLEIFDQGLIAADVDDGSFTGTRDGGVTIDDLLYFLFRFDAGC